MAHRVAKLRKIVGGALLAISLLLLLISLGLWTRGARHVDMFVPNNRNWNMDCLIISGGGQLYIGVTRIGAGPEHYVEFKSNVYEDTSGAAAWRFFWGDGEYSAHSIWRFLVAWRRGSFPLAVISARVWIVSLFACIAPAYYGYGRVQRRKRLATAGFEVRT